jgi:hypothetical protein
LDAYQAIGAVVSLKEDLPYSEDKPWLLITELTKSKNI